MTDSKPYQAFYSYTDTEGYEVDDVEFFASIDEAKRWINDHGAERTGEIWRDGKPIHQPLENRT